MATLLTGGYIGSHMVYELADAGESVLSGGRRLSCEFLVDEGVFRHREALHQPQRQLPAGAFVTLDKALNALGKIAHL